MKTGTGSEELAQADSQKSIDLFLDDQTPPPPLTAV